MALSRRRIVGGLVWLAIYGLCVTLWLVRREGWGVWDTAAALVAVGMLTVFATDFVLRGAAEGSVRDRLGDYAVVALVIGAVLVLASFFLAALLRLDIGPMIILGVFLLVFVRILRDYVGALRKKYRR